MPNLHDDDRAFSETLRKTEDLALATAKRVAALRCISVIRRQVTTPGISVFAELFVAAIEREMGEITK